MNGITKKEFGDYQTPKWFCDCICNYLKNNLNLNPKIIIEPTCGIGNFLLSCYNIFKADLYYGNEINREYIENVRDTLLYDNVILFNENIFNFDIKSKLSKIEDVLIIGNPPWINNTNLSIINSSNKPKKSNIKNLKGLDALTGNSNFDISEYIILKIINSFKDTNSMIAMLCKNSVARNLFKEVKKNNIYFEYCKVLEFDANEVFSISASCCLFVIKLVNKNISSNICEVGSFFDKNITLPSFGYVNNKFVSNMNYKNDIDGNCCFEWRQGIKHDCSAVMELCRKDNYYTNSKNETINIEDDAIYPLIKSSHIKKYLISSFEKHVIVTQKKVKQDTSYLEKTLPKTWDYLMKNINSFKNRKSSIYNNSPIFSMFGVGEYSFLPYKVIISGFYKKPIFSLVFSDKSVMADDTCYFIGFDNYDDAYISMLILNSELVQNFLHSISFSDSKRPYTKKVLQRIDFVKCLDYIEFEVLNELESNLKLNKHITKTMYDKYYKLINSFKENILF